MRCHTGSRGKNNLDENPPPRCRVVFVFGSLPIPSSCLAPRLAFYVLILLSISWTHHLIIDWPYHQQTATLPPHDSVSYLSACLFSFHFHIFLLVACYSVVQYLTYRCYWRSRALFLVQYHVVVERSSRCSVYYILQYYSTTVLTDTRLVEMRLFCDFNDSVTMMLPDTFSWNSFIQCFIRVAVELSSFCIVIFCACLRLNFFNR